jgi:MFS family permease
MEATNNNPVAVSLLTVLEYVPIFLFSFIGGALADRLNPKKIMILGDFLSGISIVIILLFVSAGFWQALFLATFVSAIVTQMSLPSSLVMFKRFLPEEHITSAMAISQSTSSVFTIIGPIIGTIIFTRLGIQTSLIIIAILFFCSSIIEFALPTFTRNSQTVKFSLFQQVKEGFVYVKDHMNLVIISCICLTVGIGQGIINPLGVYVIIERLGLDKENIQWFYSLSGLGLLAGGVIAALISQKLNVKIITFIGMCFFSIGIILEVLSVWVVFTAGVRIFVGIIMALVQVVLNTLLLKHVQEEYVGRVNGIIIPVMTGAVLIGSSLSGVMMKSITLIPTYFIASFIILIGAFISLRLRLQTEEKINTESCSLDM